MPVLARPGGSIRYQSSGSGSPALLLTHGYAATSAMFALNLPALSLRNQVLTWDLRGHGGGGYPADPVCYSAASALPHLAALMDAGGLDRAALRGHSLRRHLSLHLALTCPD